MREPDEVVAIGASIQGAQLIAWEARPSLLLIDVTPLSLGHRNLARADDTMVQRNTAIPKKRRKSFPRLADNQTTVEIQVYQGERPMGATTSESGNFHWRASGGPRGHAADRSDVRHRRQRHPPRCGQGQRHG